LLALECGELSPLCYIAERCCFFFFRRAVAVACFGVRRALAALLYRGAMPFLLLLPLLFLLLLPRCRYCFRYPAKAAHKRLASRVLQGGNCGRFAVFVVAPRRVKAARARRTPKASPVPPPSPFASPPCRQPSKQTRPNLTSPTHKEVLFWYPTRGTAPPSRPRKARQQ
jgi:hypothetical protein